MRTFLLVVALSVSGYSFAESHPITNTNDGKKQAQHSENNKNSSKESFQTTQSIQKTTHTQQYSADDSNDESAESGRFSFGWWLKWFYKFIDDPISLFTFILAISTILLWADTRRLRILANQQSTDTKESLIISKQAADAAKISADAATAANRAYLYFHGATFYESVPKDKVFLNYDKSRNRYIIFGFKNHGNTLADVTHLECFTRLDKDFPTDDEVNSIKQSGGAINKIVEANTISFPVNHFFFISDSDYLRVKNGQINLYLFGAIWYDDIFKAIHKNTFVLQFMVESKSFAAISKEQ